MTGGEESRGKKMLSMVTNNTGVTVGILIACMGGAYVTGSAVSHNRGLIERNERDTEDLRSRMVRMEAIASSQQELNVKLSYMVESSKKRLDLLEQILRFNKQIPENKP